MSIARSTQAGQKVYDDGEITSNRANVATSHLILKFDREEAAKILVLR